MKQTYQCSQQQRLASTQLIQLQRKWLKDKPSGKRGLLPAGMAEAMASVAARVLIIVNFILASGSFW